MVFEISQKKNMPQLVVCNKCQYPLDHTNIYIPDYLAECCKRDICHMQQTHKNMHHLNKREYENYACNTILYIRV